VDGAVSNIPGSAYLKLTKTSPYNNPKKIYVNAAKVTLIDNLGNETHFLNSTNGKYAPGDPQFCGTIGRSYKIRIETANGQICESEFEEMKQPIALDSVKYVFKDGATDEEKGLMILLDVNNTENLNTYFYWEYTETWEIEAPFLSSFKPNSTICYKIYTPPVFNIYSTGSSSRKQIIDYPLFFINNTTNRLYRKYSVIVTQHTLNERTYTFYHDLKDINEDKGSLFDTAPVTLIGNINNLSNPVQPVLGNFQVSGSATQRIFITNDEIKSKLNVPSGYEKCELKYGGLLTDGAMLDSLIKAGWTVFDKSFNNAANDTILSLTNYRGCCDCTKDGTNVKPDYWDNE
jgi:hypothetical protein